MKLSTPGATLLVLQGQGLMRSSSPARSVFAVLTLPGAGCSLLTDGSRSDGSIANESLLLASGTVLATSPGSAVVYTGLSDSDAAVAAFPAATAAEADGTNMQV